MQLIQQAREWLAAVNPALPAVALIVIVWAPQAAIRRWAPKLWEIPASWGPKANGLRQAWQAAPSLMAGAFFGAMSSGGDPWEAAMGALVAIGAPAWHHALRAAPIPYQGELGSKKPKREPKQNSDDDDTDPIGPKPSGGAGVGLMALMLVGCGVIGPNVPDDPCPGATRAELQCAAMAADRCEGKPWAECPARDDITADCDALIEKEADKCNF